MSSPGTFSETDVQYRLLNCSIQSSRPATLPRRTVIEALGRVNVVCELARIAVATGGLSGSAWLFGPSFFQTYCSLPKVTSVTGPAKEASRFFLESSNVTRTSGILAPTDLASFSGSVDSNRV